MWAILQFVAVGVVVTTASKICPSGCFCADSTIECYQIDTDFFRDFPTGTGVRWSELQISNSPNLTTLNFTDTSLFHSLKGFKHLKFANCSIELIIGDENSQLVDVLSLSLDDNYFIDDSSIPAIRMTFPRLRSLSLRNNYVGMSQTDGEVGLSQFLYLEFVDLSGNQLIYFPFLPEKMREADMSRNLITNVTNKVGVQGKNLSRLDLSQNQLESCDFRFLRYFKELKSLNLSGNLLTSLTWFASLPPSNLKMLDVSWNRLNTFDVELLGRFPKLEEFNMTGNNLEEPMGIFPRHSTLKSLQLESSLIEFVFLNEFSQLENLRLLSFAYSPRLTRVFGSLRDLSKIQRLSLRNCNITGFSPGFLEKMPSNLEEFDISRNPLMCDCRGQWLLEFSARNRILVDLNETVCGGPEDKKGIQLDKLNRDTFRNESCHLGIYASSGVPVVWGRYGTEARLSCNAYGNPPPSIIWRPSKYSELDANQFIYMWNGTTEAVEMPENNSFGVVILPGGTLMISSPNRSHVSRFECLAINTWGNTSAVVSFKLDYNEWRIMMLYSCLCGVATAIGFCILNIIYGCLRQLIVWRLSKMQENSRIRMMVEALEKYRQRQTDALQQTYARRVEVIRDNYHSQADMLRRSYAAQLERFRDYRAAQIGSVSQHFEAMRENYNTQVGRIGYYGGRQMERLFDSYQQQINRIRAFTLQQRLRLMRQYKIKQRYLDKILHGMNVESCHDVPKDSVFFSGPDRMPQFPGAEEILASDQLEPLALGLMGQEDNMPMCDGLSMGKTVEDYETSDDISISTYHSFGVEDPDEIPPLIPAEVVPWLRGGSRAGSRRSRSAPSPQPTSSALEIEICSGEDTISPNNSSSRLLEKESNC